MNDEFLRGFNEELKKIAVSLGGIEVRPEHLIGGGLGAAAGGVGGYYAGKELTGTRGGGVGGAALGALGGGALGAAAGGAIGGAVREGQGKVLQDPTGAPAQQRFAQVTGAPAEKPLLGQGTQQEWDRLMQRVQGQTGQSVPPTNVDFPEGSTVLGRVPPAPVAQTAARPGGQEDLLRLARASFSPTVF